MFPVNFVIIWNSMRICMHKNLIFWRDRKLWNLKTFKSTEITPINKPVKSLFSRYSQWSSPPGSRTFVDPQGRFRNRISGGNRVCIFFGGVRKSDLGEIFGLQHTSSSSILTLSFFHDVSNKGKQKKIRSKNPPSTTLNYPGSPHRPRSFRNTQLLCQQPCQGQLANLGPRLQSMAPSILS